MVDLRLHESRSKGGPNELADITLDIMPKGLEKLGIESIGTRGLVWIKGKNHVFDFLF